MIDKIYPTYNGIHNEVIEYADGVKENLVQFDHIIALVRGGSLIGTILSHALGTPLTNTQYSSVHGKGEADCSILNNLPRIYGERLLIVDDICDSGYSLREVVAEYESRGHDVTTYTVYYRNTPESVHLPNYSIELLDNSWVVFPWEDSTPIVLSNSNVL